MFGRYVIAENNFVYPAMVSCQVGHALVAIFEPSARARPVLVVLLDGLVKVKLCCSVWVARTFCTKNIPRMTSLARATAPAPAPCRACVSFARGAGRPTRRLRAACGVVHLRPPAHSSKRECLLVALQLVSL